MAAILDFDVIVTSEVKFIIFFRKFGHGFLSIDNTFLPHKIKDKRVIGPQTLDFRYLGVLTFATRDHVFPLNSISRVDVSMKLCSYVAHTLPSIHAQFSIDKSYRS